jgi:hypothetical protein
MGKQNSKKEKKGEGKKPTFKFKEPILKLKKPLSKINSKPRDNIFKDVLQQDIDDLKYQIQQVQQLLSIQEQIQKDRQQGQSQDVQALRKALESSSLHDLEIDHTKEIISEVANEKNKDPTVDFVQTLESTFNEKEKTLTNRIMQTLVIKNYVKRVSLKHVQDFIKSGYTMVTKHEIILWTLLFIASTITILASDRWGCAIPNTEYNLWVSSAVKRISGSAVPFGVDDTCLQKKATVQFWSQLALSMGSLGLTTAIIRKYVKDSFTSKFLHALAFGVTGYLYSAATVVSLFTTKIGSKIAGYVSGGFLSLSLLFMKSSAFRSWVLDLVVNASLIFSNKKKNQAVIQQMKEQNKKLKENGDITYDDIIEVIQRQQKKR